MYKNIFFILFIVLVGVGAVFVFRPTNKPSVQPARTTNEVAAATAPKAPDQNLSQEQNGIEITIEQIEQQDERTVLTVGLSNHQYDLGQDSIYDNAKLNGQTSKSHTFLSNNVGGHHVQAQIVFDKTTSGSFEITPVDGTTFTFADVW
jgi:hypothetical protein